MDMPNGGRKTSLTPSSEAKSTRIDPTETPAAEGVLVPLGRWDRGAWLFRDATLRRLEILLDEAFRLPFTRFRFGIDGMEDLFDRDGVRRESGDYFAQFAGNLA